MNCFARLFAMVGILTRGSVAPGGELVNCSPLPNYRALSAIVLSTNKHIASARMSYSVASHPTTSSSNNYQLIINNALKVYEKRTKQDLLAHPLASQLQTCNSPANILAILQQHVQGPDQSRSGDDRWTKWLDPTINVLYTFSATLGEGVGLVSLKIRTYLRSALTHYIYDRYSRPRR
jgi:hypothetical protein